MSPRSSATIERTSPTATDAPRFDKCEAAPPVRDDIPTSDVPHAPLGDPEFMAGR